MNIEEKAKAYDEALKDMMAIYPNLKGDAKLAVEHAFPELAESEDERIRRKMIEHFKAKTKEKWCNMPVKDIIAWLEKQKEQKPVKSIFPPGLGEAHFNPAPVVEQKPAEWSEEDEKKMIFLERLIEYNVPDGQYGWADGRKGGFVTKSEAISMLKSLRPVSKDSLQSLWKPSEEQMEALEYVIRDYREDSCNATANYLQEILDHLKNM